MVSIQAILYSLEEVISHRQTWATIDRTRTNSSGVPELHELGTTCIPAAEYW